MRAFFPIILIVLLMAHEPQAVGARLKDLTALAGVRDNQLVGYGLIVGLAGDGDKNMVYTVQAIANMLQKFGIVVPAATLQSKNVAAVIVTADIPAYAKLGSRLDVTISSLGDAKSLQGGVLLQTPLQGINQEIYALAQGPTSVGGVLAGGGGGGGASVQKNHPTVAQIIGGAIVEKEIETTIVKGNRLELILRDPDFTSAARIAATINELFPNLALAIDKYSIQVKIPAGWEDQQVDFIARLEAIEVTPDISARIVINERTGTIVANARIRIDHCVVSQGSLTITIASTLDTSQPAPFSQTGQTMVTPRTDTKVNESKAAVINLPEMPTVEKVASALNALGVTPRDLMAIFQAMKQAGALQAELVMK